MWSIKLGNELRRLGEYATNYKVFHEKYKDAVIYEVDGKKASHDIAKKIQLMMASKIDAVKVCRHLLSS